MITVIKRPMLTEKAAMLAEKQQYAFEVTTDANKIQIKAAIERLYDVKVS
ncbi:MAG: 50S ribosomal protein L23, partial [Bacteroidota bacterium]